MARIAWTVLSFIAARSIVVEAEMPLWATIAAEALIVLVWAVLVLGRTNVSWRIGSMLLLVLMLYIAAAGVFAFAPNGLPDWTIAPILAVVTGVWYALLRRPERLLTGLGAIAWLCIPIVTCVGICMMTEMESASVGGG